MKTRRGESLPCSWVPLKGLYRDMQGLGFSKISISALLSLLGLGQKPREEVPLACLNSLKGGFFRGILGV